jgi:hypothetical protein
LNKDIAKFIQIKFLSPFNPLPNNFRTQPWQVKLVLFLITVEVVGKFAR